MKQICSTLFLIGYFFVAMAQLNTTLLANLKYNAELNDVWGWVAPNGTEYALVGVQTGVSIVSLADPRNPKEVAFVPGAFSIWRDLKTWGNFAYVTTDQSGTSEGLLVIDLSQLPAKVTYTNWKPNLENGTLRTCHNLYIDENGVCYLAGCNLNSGGILFVDVASTPGEPIYMGKGPAIYAHDVYAQNNIMYASELYLGRLGIYDVSDMTVPKLIGAQNTPFRFTHNAWASENNEIVFTTDERANAPIGAYDVSDLDNIQELDQFRPAYTLGSGTIPHNVHVQDDYLHISYYTAGGVIVDASRPDNLIEVANWDSYLGPEVGFFGAWGMYPFLPSGNVLISDINNGLFIIQPNLKRACFLEGKITDISNNQPLAGAEIKIISAQPNIGTSDIAGNYKTGQALAGTFDVTITREGYQPKTVQATLQNGIVTILDVALTPLATFSVSGKTVNSLNGDAVPFAKVIISNEDYFFETTANTNGNFSLGNVFSGEYDIAVGAWGFMQTIVENLTIDNHKSVTIALDRGYQDDFFFDLGWTTSSDSATAGFWERNIPKGTFYNNQLASPSHDIPEDLGESCYVTGNAEGQAGNSDVDNGRVQLISPPMNLSNYENPTVRYYLWFFNDGGTGASPDDELSVRISNGREVVTLETVQESQGAWREQSEFTLRDRIDLTDNMTIIFETADLPPNGHIVKAAIDAFSVQESTTTPIEEPLAAALAIKAFPNPFQQQTTMLYHLTDQMPEAIMLVYNALGQIVQRIFLPALEGSVSIGNELNPGLYFLRIQSGNLSSPPFKLLKIK